MEFQKKLVSEYIKIMRLCKKNRHIEFKMQSMLGKTDIYLQDMRTKEVYISESINENRDKEQVLREVEAIKRKLIQRVWRVNQKNHTYLYEYMTIYQNFMYIVRNYPNHEIIFLVQQHTANQTTMSILDIEDPENAYALYIDEDDDESLQELLWIGKKLMQNHKDIQAESDDQMNILDPSIPQWQI